MNIAAINKLSKEDQCLCHRYLYYVMNETLISDIEYDKLEKEALAEVNETSPLHKVGSELSSSYPQGIIDMFIKI